MAAAGSLIVVHVHVRVKPDGVQAFRAASIDNARDSVREPGVARFDVVQSTEDPTRFVLVEVYRTADAPAAHKATAHYARWRDAVAELMAEPRSAVKYVNVAPEDADW
jgi:(4S)-4-hydroxy-5-phosphonooxypentane-2,3-dione isomerase